MDPKSAFLGLGEFGDLVLATDWGRTPLGPLEAWPLSLVLHVKMMLSLPTPAIIFWGPEQTQIYNAGYAVIMGPRHPRFFGAPYRECWPDTYPIVYPWMRRLFETGEITHVERTLIPVTRHGFTEETYFTFSFSPLHGDTGRVEGIFQPVVEVTDAVLADRRAEMLRALVPKADTVEPVPEIMQTLDTNPSDIPFAALYLWDEAEAGLRLVSRSRTLEAAGPLPDDLEATARQAFASKAPLHRENPKGWLGGQPVGPWPEPISGVLAHPIRRSDSDSPRGVVVFGLSPRLRFDDKYRAFLEVAVGQMAAVIDTLSAFQDARKRAEALAELDRAKTEFFHNVSHEFRTPLTLIQGPVEDLLAQGEAKLPREILDQVGLIHRNSLRLLKLVNTLLDFSRIESGRLQASFEPTDLAAFTAELATLYLSALEQSHLRLELDLPPLPEPAYVDREMWEKIVLNLLSNAFKYTFEGGISVSLRSADGYLELTVSDTGTGIPAEELPRIFTRFHRVKGAQGRTLEGTGIGLAMVQELVHLHGGKVRVESRLGEGTVFTVSIPRGHAHLPQGQIRAPQGDAHVTPASRPYVEDARRHRPPDGSNPGEVDPTELEVTPAAPLSQTPGLEDGGLVFIVDDNEDILEHVNRVLRPRFRTLLFRNGREALAAAIEKAPDLILSDVMMPGLDGFGLLQALRADARTSKIPFILLSARAGEEATVEGVQSGADDYLVKPFSSRELVARVASRIEIAALRRRKEEVVARLLAREQAAHARAEAHRHRLHALFMEAPALIALFRGPDHVIEFQNPIHQQLYLDRDIVGKSIREVLPPPDGQGVAALLDRVYRTGESHHGREFPVTADWGRGFQEEKFFNFVYQPTRDAQGDIEGIAVFAFEVTEQVLDRKRAEAIAADIRRQHEQLKQVEEALRESEERLRLSLESARLGAWDCDLITGIVTLTERAREILDVPAEAVLRLDDFMASVHPDDRARIQGALAEALDPQGDGLYNAEYRASGFRDAKERTFAVRARVFFGESGTPYRFMGTVLDISDRKAAEREVHQFKTLIEESRDAVMLLDFEGRISYQNAAGQRLSGEEGFPLRQPGTIFDLALPGDEAMTRRILEEALEAGFWQGEYRLRHARDRQALPIWWNLFVLREHDTGRPFALASVVRDLTQIKETEEHLRQTQKMEAVGKLAGGIAHDFNNLLTAINGYADLALAGTREASLREFLQEIRKSGERAAVLTRQLLAYSRKQVLAPRAIDLNAIIADMEQMLRRLIGEDIELTTRLDPALGLSKADPGQVEQIILNLVFNARDAMPEGGRLVLETGNVVLDDSRGSTELETKPGPYAMLTVRDTGIGMSEETIARIFEPFFTTKEVGKGTGLGLSSVYGILKQSGGSVTVESRPGMGTTFRVYLPLMGNGEAPESQPDPAGDTEGHPPGKELILLVEDEEPVRKFVRKILQMQGYRVLEARNGAEALDIARKHPSPIQVLLTDVIMPQMGGQKLVEQFRPLHPEASVVFMSGYAADLLTTPVVADGHAVFLKKPFTSSELFGKIQESLRGAGSRVPEP